MPQKINQAQAHTGTVVQVVTSMYSAVATGTTVFPLDDTIPQNNEGTEFMTASITPKSSSNTLVIEIIFMGSPGTAPADVIVALFQDSTANALAATSTVQSTGTWRTIINLTHSMTAGTTSATTFKVRAGPGAAGTLTFNGFNAGRVFGTTTKSSIVITEYKA